MAGFGAALCSFRFKSFHRRIDRPVEPHCPINLEGRNEAEWASTRLMKNKSPSARLKAKRLAKSSSRTRSTGNAKRATSKPRTKRRSASNARKRILLVDDDPQSLEVFSALLNEAGYQVDRAANALAAICAVIRHAPDLVLADIRMPIIDGAELARELKRHRDSRHIPVVALTGYDAPGMRESALQSGYDDYITKPVTLHKFREQLASVFRQGKARRSA
jgi:two-component system cell cycle response regulator DivK